MRKYDTHPDVIPGLVCPRCGCRIFIAENLASPISLTMDRFKVKCTSYCGFEYFVEVDRGSMDYLPCRDAVMDAARDGWTALRLREL